MGKNQRKSTGFSRAKRGRAAKEFGREKKVKRADGSTKVQRSYQRRMYGLSTGGGSIGLFGASNIRRLDLEEVAREFCGREVIRYGISGATSFKLKRNVDHLILQQNQNQNQIEAIIIHGGTNDVWGPAKRHPAVSKQQIAQDIMDIAIKCLHWGVQHVFISGIPPIGNDTDNDLAAEVNQITQRHCQERGDIVYIDNSWISREHDLCDAVHLTDHHYGHPNGQSKFINNLGRVLRIHRVL